MKMKLTKVISLVLALTLLLVPLTGCGKDKENDDGGGGMANAKGMVYLPEFFELGEDFPDVDSMFFHNEEIFFTSTKYPDYPEFPEMDGVEPPEGDDGTDDPGGDDTDTQDDDGADTPDDAGEPDDNTDDSMPEPDYDPGFNPDYNYEPPVTKLYKMNVDGSNLTELLTFDTSAPEGYEGNSDVQVLGIDVEGRIWTYESGWFYPVADEPGEEPDFGNSLETYSLKILDGNGNELSEVDLDEYRDPDYGSISLYNAKVTKEGLLAFVSNDSGDKSEVTVIDDKGTKHLSVEVDGWVYDIIPFGNGDVGISYYDPENQSQVIKFLDFEAKGWGEAANLPREAGWNSQPGNDEYDLFYVSGVSLYGYKMETGEAERVLNLINCDINVMGGNFHMQALSDGRVAVLNESYDYSSDNYSRNYELAILTEHPASELPEKTTLRLAGVHIDYDLVGEVVKYNKASTKYRIEVEDYSEYNDYESDDGWNMGATRLATEIISGKVPDLLTSYNLPIKQYAKKGLFEDLYTFMDDDPELSRDILLPGVKNLLEVDGKMVQAAATFSVQAFLGLTEIVGPELSWTMEDFNRAFESMPEGATAFTEMTKEWFLSYICAYGIDDLVDWETGECSFDSDNFISMLELANTYPDEYDYGESDEPMMWVPYEQRLLDREVMIVNSYIYDLDDARMSMLQLGGQGSYKGFPTEKGSGIMAYVSDGLLISSACKDKEGAWDFVRRVLTVEYQTNDSNAWRMSGLCTNKNAMDQIIEKSMTPDYGVDENGEKVEIPKRSFSLDGGYRSYGGGSGAIFFSDEADDENMIHMYAATQEEIDALMEVVNSVSSSFNYDEGLMKIIQEEAEPYFKGEKSAKDAAGIIQNRVRTYVGEQR